MAEPAQLPPTALAGVKVLDLSRVLAGPWSTQILGDLGADVIKIESLQGDDTRQWGPPFTQAVSPDALAEAVPATSARGDSAYYLCANRNKRSVAVDLATAEGQALLQQLALKADVLIENFKLNGLKKYGLDAARVRQLNPKLVYCSITGFGQTGPYAERPGYDFVAQAMGGLMSITGTPASGPLRVGVAVTDLATGLYATIAILAALRHAERTGVGQHIDVALLDTQVAMLANQAANYLVSGAAPGLIGNTHPTIVPYQVFATQDLPLVIAVGNDGQFRALCEILKHPEWAQDARFASNRQRVTHRDRLVALLQAELLTQSSQHWLPLLLAQQVPAGPVNGLNEVFNDPQVKARGLVQTLKRAGESLPGVAFPVKLSATPARAERAPPRLAQHTQEVLADWLGLSAAEITRLIAKKAIMNAPIADNAAE